MVDPGSARVARVVRGAHTQHRSAPPTIKLRFTLATGVAVLAINCWQLGARSALQPSLPEREDAAVAVASLLPLPPLYPPPAFELQLMNKPPPTTEWTTMIVERGDNLSAIFTRLGIDLSELYRLLRTPEASEPLNRLVPGQEIRLRIDASKQVRELSLSLDPIRSLHLVRASDAFRVDILAREVETRIAHATATIESSLFEAGQAAGLSDAVILALAEIFGWDIDFSLDIRRGDRFTVIYEEHYAEGDRVGDGPILAAAFSNQGNTFRVLRYVDHDGNAGYYTPDGRSVHKAFLRSPVKFTRISSGFTSGRLHPVLHRFRAHKGVDYAAPEGTPVRATADGRVTFKGRKGGYGNVVTLEHRENYSTLYAHLAGFAQGLLPGRRVRQGDIIGYVGSTGLATGPHLHYEFHINGTQHDPLTAPLLQAEPIGSEDWTDFRSQARVLLAELELYRDAQLAAREP